MPLIRINGVEQDFPEGLSLLQACRRMSLDIPALCHDDRLQPTGACRLCSVEIEGSDRLVTACTTPLVDGMVVQTHSPGVESIRRTLLGLMAERHPGDPDAATHPTPLQQELLRHQVSVGAAVGELRAPGSGTPVGPHQDPPFLDSSRPHLHVDLLRCILCYRCVRICDEEKGRGVWQVWNHGDRTLIRPDGPTLATSSCVGCGACADTCPSGALGDRHPEDGSTPDRWTRTTRPYCGSDANWRSPARERASFAPARCSMPRSTRAMPAPRADMPSTLDRLRTGSQPRSSDGPGTVGLPPGFQTPGRGWCGGLPDAWKVSETTGAVAALESWARPGAPTRRPMSPRSSCAWSLAPTTSTAAPVSPTLA